VVILQWRYLSLKTELAAAEPRPVDVHIAKVLALIGLSMSFISLYLDYFLFLDLHFLQEFVHLILGVSF
jgi:multisubunit Na+/H+ antiporter MnhB subunit